MPFGMLALFAIVPMTLHAAYDYDREQIQKRISPIGKVRIKEDIAKPSDVPAIVEPVKEKTASRVPGQEVYEKYCAVCHRSGVAGAPKFRDSSDWKPRLSQLDLKGLTQSAIKGLNAMPPKGTCQECTEADIYTAVQYMVPQS